MSQTWPSCWEAEWDLVIAFSAGCLETWELEALGIQDRHLDFWKEKVLWLGLG